MPKYLIQGSYTSEGTRGVLKEGGTGRKEAVEKLVRGLGGRVEAMYFTFGGDDFMIIADVPDSASMVAASFVPRASGTVNVRTTQLISPEEVDEGVRKSVNFRPAGT
ncbi:MAG TPA: GYD domain-containing protein [Nitrososphaerales archaeon]|nr:GYD domain-containing protein [Nitrososphaerales archaeon]